MRRQKAKDKELVHEVEDKDLQARNGSNKEHLWSGHECGYKVGYRGDFYRPLPSLRTQ